MTKKLLMNSIKDVLGENLSEIKSKDKELLLNQKVVATSLSNNKINKTIEETFDSQFNAENKKNSKFYNLEALTRAWFDFNSLNKRYNNNEIFEKYCPKNGYKKNIFEIFNSSRCLSIGLEEYVGCKKNIKTIHNSLASILNLQNKEQEEFLFRSLLNFFGGKKIKDIMFFRNNFPGFSEKKLFPLIKSIKDQEEFSKLVIKLIKDMKMLENEEKQNADNSISNNEELESQKKKKDKKKIEKISFSEFLKSKKKTVDQNKQDFKDLKEQNIKTKQSYKVFTKEYDISMHANKLADKKELRELRKKFDKEYLDNTRLINKLAKKLERLLSSLNYNSWKFDQEEGFFDTSRFANFISNPNNSLIFKFEKESIDKNTVVSLLLDNSGSMRGKPIITSAITAEIITKVLEKCRVNVELLGFTTKEWKGGKSKKKWESLGKTDNPGRLNDLLHIIYKDADTKWGNCKNNLGLILKEGLLKENIDGEALTWANSRLKVRQEKKKILIVISDGAPVDDSTLSANSPEILDDHLKEVVLGIEKTTNIKLLAIGIGHDVSKYYKNAFVIEDAKNLGDVIIDNLSLMLGAKKY